MMSVFKKITNRNFGKTFLKLASMDFQKIASRVANAVAVDVSQSMTVKQLIDLLSREDPDAPVGAVMSSYGGYVQTIQGVVKTTDGVVCIDQGDTTIGDDQHEFA